MSIKTNIAAFAVAAVALTGGIAATTQEAHAGKFHHHHGVGIGVGMRKSSVGTRHRDLRHVAVSTLKRPRARGEVEVPHPLEAFVKAHPPDFAPTIVEKLMPAPQGQAVALAELDRALYAKPRPLDLDPQGQLVRAQP